MRTVDSVNLEKWKNNMRCITLPESVSVDNLRKCLNKYPAVTAIEKSGIVTGIASEDRVVHVIQRGNGLLLVSTATDLPGLLAYALSCECELDLVAPHVNEVVDDGIKSMELEATATAAMWDDLNLTDDQRFELGQRHEDEIVGFMLALYVDLTPGSW
ncbi:hypothetical protein [Pseudomonas sp.]|uniref:hypothetical protein n=1 Tax=Pseudomonas sp. TaxID=306 RepID=UPI002611099D|nr:hypothetical protein [Pseudomonas sp.]